MIQKLRNAVVAPTGMGKNYGRIMPLLRQGWLVRQKIMHYGFLDNASQDAFAAKRKHSNCTPPVGSDKYLVFNLHQLPSQSAHVQ